MTTPASGSSFSRAAKRENFSCKIGGGLRFKRLALLNTRLGQVRKPVDQSGCQHARAGRTGKTGGEVKTCFVVVWVCGILMATLGRPAFAQELTAEQQKAVDGLYAEAQSVEDRAQKIFAVWWATHANVIDDAVLRSKCAEYAVGFAQLQRSADSSVEESAKLARRAAEAAISELASELSAQVWKDTKDQPIPFTIRVAAAADSAFKNYRLGYVNGDSVNWFTVPEAYKARCLPR